MARRVAIVGGVLGVAAAASMVLAKRDKSVPRKKVVVVGGGYAGRSFVKTIDTNKYDVVLVDRHLHKEDKSYLSGLIKFKTLNFQPQPNYVDSISENKIVNQFMILPAEVVGIQDDCVGVDKEKNTITLKSKDVINYDYLVFATGSIPDTYHIQMQYSCKNSMCYFFKDRSDLETLMTVFKIIGLDDVVIMGGGITGVELASELSRRILDTCRSKEEAAKIAKTITIVEPGERLLPKMNEEISRVVTKHLQDQKVEILTNSVITTAEDGVLRLVRNGTEKVNLKAVVAVWTCGVKADELAMRCIGHNQVLDTLHLPSLDSSLLETTSATVQPANVFAIGDCNHLLPKSAQNAKQQGAYLANYFNSGFNPSAVGYKFTSQGTMIRLADRIYMDSPLYSGFLPLWVHRVIIGLDI
eukprot:gene30202-34089_t